MFFAPQRRALFRHLNFQKWSEPGFVHFDFEMRFGPQRRALFRHLNFQKWSEPGFVRFDFEMRFGPQRRALFRHLNFQKWSEPGFVHLDFECASRHNGVQFFISHLASWLRARRFSEPTFRPSGATNHWKNTVFRDFPTFSRTCIFFLLTLSLLWSSLFYSSLLSDSSHLCFHPSTMWYVFQLSCGVHLTCHHLGAPAPWSKPWQPLGGHWLRSGKVR